MQQTAQLKFKSSCTTTISRPKKTGRLSLELASISEMWFLREKTSLETPSILHPESNLSQIQRAFVFRSKFSIKCTIRLAIHYCHSRELISRTSVFQPSFMQWKCLGMRKTGIRQVNLFKSS